jgi:hypothetical protein
MSAASQNKVALRPGDPDEHQYNCLFLRGLLSVAQNSSFRRAAKVSSCQKNSIWYNVCCMRRKNREPRIYRNGAAAASDQYPGQSLPELKG